jgi:hypothetical protein
VAWSWQPFKNSARSDALMLKHWVKTGTGGTMLPGSNGGDVGGDYAFSKYNKKVDMVMVRDGPGRGGGDHIIGIISSGSYHRDHIIGIISSGSYHGDHIMGSHHPSSIIVNVTPQRNPLPSSSPVHFPSAGVPWGRKGN